MEDPQELIRDLAARAARVEPLIQPYIRETPLYLSDALSAAIGGEALAKLENLQVTGSFKVRGALSKLLVLPEDVRARGVIAASSGNHGAAVAYGARALGIPAVIYVPDHAAPAKVAAIRALGAEVRAFGDDTLLAEVHARAEADARGLAYLSPYNDPDVVAGQGTIGIELARAAPLDAIVVAVGGGGMIAGIAAVLKSHWPQLRVIGALPANSPVMAESVRAGRILDLPGLPTLSDGTAGGIEEDSITFPLCRTLVDAFVLVTEEEIAEAIRLFIDDMHLVIEGAAGVAVAAVLRSAEELRGLRVGVVICGGNISRTQLRAIV